MASAFDYILLNGLWAQIDAKFLVTPFANRPIVFDYQSKLVKIMRTDCMMIALDVDEKEQKCYVLAYNEDEESEFGIRKSVINVYRSVLLTEYAEFL